MSLDLYILSTKPIKKTGSGIYVRDQGKTRELKTKEEIQKWFPGSDVEIKEYETTEIFDGNITHNLAEMASHVISGDYTLYTLLWEPFVCKVTQEYIDCVKKGLEYLTLHEEDLKPYNPSNGWGSYETLLDFTRSFITTLDSLNLSEDTYTIYASV